MHACQAALRYTAGDSRLETLGVVKCDRFRTLAKKIIGMSKQEQENAIPTFTRKVMKDQRTLIRFSLRIPFEDETIICEGLQSLWQSVRQGRKNFRGMWERVFQSEELRSMWQSTIVPQVS